MGFISEIAASLYRRYGEEISSLRIVFPSRRARLFFNDALARLADRPLWQPLFLSIDQLMAPLAGLETAGNEKLIAELYRIYSEYHDETFDSFYFWGEMLLADFDQIDKYRVDADALFANIDDLKAIDERFGELTGEQREIITRFWRNFHSGNPESHEKGEFLRIWKTLRPIYHRFRGALDRQGLAYAGMIHRRAAENLLAGVAQVAPHKYIVAGFNALTECEKTFFDHLRREGLAEFFWDCDDYYLDDAAQEAGLFLRENVRRYPQREPFAAAHFTQPKRIAVVSSPSDALQAKYVADFLRTAPHDKSTAIVLTDENLLLPVLYSAAAVADRINVTMGYPLRQTLACSFVERLLALQGRARNGQFHHSDAVGLLSHPFIKDSAATGLIKQIREGRLRYVEGSLLRRSPLSEAVFVRREGWRQLAEYLVDALTTVARQPCDGDDRGERTEYFATLVDTVRRVAGSVENCGLEPSDRVFISLLRRHLQTVRIPYEGEPLRGVQIMGILETRSLDFDNVLLLSANDDTFPGNRRGSPSFIPYNLRGAYGLPDASHHEGVYAYYFYRLLQRARRIEIAYCSTSDERRTGEESRYIYQLRYESPHTVVDRQIALDVSHGDLEPIEIAKTGRTAAALDAFMRGERRLSPSSFYAYVECPLKFYFRAVLRLNAEEELTEEIEAPMFGNILHRAMELLYAPLVGATDAGVRIGALIGSAQVSEAVESAIRSEYLAGFALPREEYGGNLMLARETVTRYIDGAILPYDAAGGFTVEATEREVGCEFELDGGRKATLYGKADRMDGVGARLRIVDYKSGAPQGRFGGVETLFSPVRKERSSAVLQTLIYSMILSRDGTAGKEREPRAATAAEAIQPALYYIRDMEKPGFSPLLFDTAAGEHIASYAQCAEEFELRLGGKMAELFDTAVPFRQCDDADTCAMCDFREICKR
jgi:hypothetical protein